MDSSRSEPDGSPVFDNLDLDLVVQVLANTAFSEFLTYLSQLVLSVLS